MSCSNNKTIEFLFIIQFLVKSFSFFQIVLLSYLSQLGATWPRFKPTLIAMWFKSKPNVGLGLTYS